MSFVTVRMGGGAMAATPEPLRPERPFLVAVTGGQRYASSGLATQLDRLHAERPIRGIVQTGARGAEEAARAWAEANGVPLAIVPGLLLGGPGFRRNQRINNRQLLDLRPALVVVAHWCWKATNLAIQARYRGIPVLEVLT